MQNKAVKEVIKLAKENSHEWYGIYGGAGVGKSYTIDRIVKEAKEQNLTVTVTATTGKAASLIEGITLHSYFGMRLKVNEEATTEDEAMQPSSPTKDVNSNILIVDEASMLGRHEVKALSNMSKYFGVIVLVGDPLQLPPVKSAPPKLYQIPHVVLTEQHRMKHKAMTDLVDDIRLLLDDHINKIDLLDYVDGKSVHSVTSIPTELSSTSCAIAYHNATVESYIPTLHGDRYSLFNTVTETRLGGDSLETIAIYPNGYDLDLEITPLHKVTQLRTTRKGGHYIYRGYLLPKIDVPNQFMALSEEGTYFIAHKGRVEELKTRREEAFYKALDFKASLQEKYRENSVYKLKALFTREELKEWGTVWANYLSIASVIHIRPIEARTLHKSQGSTLKDVYVDMDDINKSRGANLNAIYVAMSRATDNLFIKTNKKELVLWSKNS